MENMNETERAVKFAIIIDRSALSPFEYQVIMNMLDSRLAEISCIIMMETPTICQSRKDSSVRNYFSSFWEQRFALDFVPTIALSKLRDESSNKERKIAKVQLSKKSFDGDILSNSITESIRGLKFILNLTQRPQDRKLFKNLSLPVWRFQFGNLKQNGPIESFFTYLYQGQQGIPIYLLSYHKDDIEILRKGFFRLDPLKIRQNYSDIAFSIMKWGKQAIIDLKNQASKRRLSKNRIKEIFKQDQTLELNLKTFGRFIISRYCAIKKNISKKFYRNLITTRRANWNIGIVEKPIFEILQEKEFFDEIRWLPKPNPWIFWADPFGIRYNDQNYIFYEKFDHSTERATIAYLKFTDDFEYSEPHMGLERPYRLSYPHLLKSDDQIYMIPETAANRTISIYEAVDFPNKWKLNKDLMEKIRRVDTTTFKFNGKWWMFSHAPEESGLYIYYAEDLLGPWHSHKNNPVKQDVRSTRSAGNVFFVKNELYRPTMDLLPLRTSYGSKIYINKIIKLTETEFREVTVKKVYPGKSWNYNEGIHTLSYIGDKYTIIDARNTVAMKISISKALKKITKRLSL